MKKVVAALGLISVISSTGCSSITPVFTKTGDFVAPALEVNCPVNVYTTQPKKAYDEIGVIDLKASCFNSCPDDNSTASGMRDLVRPEVCKAGGNAILLWEANAYGYYMKATVIKTKN